MGELTADDECATGGCCPGALSFNQARVIYRTERGFPALLSIPTTLSPLLVRRAPSGDPSIANVALHAIVCRRVIAASGVPVPSSLNEPAAPPPIGRSLAAADYADCNDFTTGRVGGPQYRVRFKDGTEDGVTVYVDGSSALSWPADTVDIDILTPQLALDLNTGLLGQGLPAQYPFGGPALEGYIDAFVYGSVSWSSRSSVAAAPGGLATFTQAVNTTGVPAEGGAPFPIFFDRPPFARRFQLTLAPGPLIAAFPVVEFMDGPTVIGVAPMGLYIAATLQLQGPADVPHECTHLRVSGGVTIPNGARVTCVWEIGVR